MHAPLPCIQAVWSQQVSPEAGALRALFAAHLEAAHVPVLHFSNWGWDGPGSAPPAEAQGVISLQGHTGAPLSPFVRALRTQLPAFVMVSDALVTLPLPPGLARAGPIGELTAGLLVCCLRHGINCCYMSDLEVDAVTAVGFMPSAERCTKQVGGAAGRGQAQTQTQSAVQRCLGLGFPGIGLLTLETLKKGLQVREWLQKN